MILARTDFINVFQTQRTPQRCGFYGVDKTAASLPSKSNTANPSNAIATHHAITLSGVLGRPAASQ